MPESAFPICRHVAAFADGARPAFDGPSVAAVIAWRPPMAGFSGRTVHTLYFAAVPSHAVQIAMIDITEEETQ